jgi:hypothetical protein
MFVATHGWVEAALSELVKAWGHFPELNSDELLRHFGEHTYNLHAAQRLIENHLWGKEIDANVTLKFNHVPHGIAGQIRCWTKWSMGRLTLTMEIEVSEMFRGSPIAQMMILVHEYAHAFHFLRSDFKRPTDNLEYENLTDLSTVALGMGNVTIYGKHHFPTIGYMPLNLIEYGQRVYENLKGKVPPNTERPRTTIRPGVDTEWIHDEPTYRPSEPAPSPPKSKKTSWSSDSLILLVKGTNKLIPLENGQRLGRSFVREHIGKSEKLNKVSREQMKIEVVNTKLTLHNLGKHEISVKVNGARTMLFGLLTLKSKEAHTVPPGSSITLTQHPVSVIFPDGSEFSIE